MRHFRVFLALVAALVGSCTLTAQAVEPSPDVDSTLTISLLTCSPGQEVSELYGHTALRVRSRRDRSDLVYNYGCYDFRAPHFVWRFVLGECDYILAAQDLRSFLAAYYLRGSWVEEQVLNLLPYEAQMLRDSLHTASLPENRVYRYNIFRDNCTTRARDVVEACIDGRVIYPMRPRRNTFRTILHQFTEGHPWAREGNDLLLGADVDTLIAERDEMFAPIYMMWYADSAVVDAGRHQYHDLVRERHTLLEADPDRQRAAAAEEPSFPLLPRTLWWLCLGVGIALAVWEYLRGRVCWMVDAVVMTLQGVGGILVTFMSVFSVHPAVGSNWLVWLLNPLPLFFVWSVVQADRRGQRHIYHRLAALLWVLFLVLCPFLGQHFAQLTLPLALLLLSRAVLHLVLYRKNP